MLRLRAEKIKDIKGQQKLSIVRKKCVKAFFKIYQISQTVMYIVCNIVRFSVISCIRWAVPLSTNGDTQIMEKCLKMLWYKIHAKVSKGRENALVNDRGFYLANEWLSWDFSVLW